MKKSLLGVLVVFLALVSGCSQKVESKPNFIFKPAPNQTDAFKVNGQTYTYAQLESGIESDIFEAETKVYELKMAKLKTMVLEKFMAADPKKGTMSNDEFLEKHIAKANPPSDKEVMDFIVSRNIPTENINDQMKERAKQFLEMEKKREAVDIWLAEQTKKSPVEVYLQKPKRPVFDVQVGEAPSVGPTDAKVTIVEFSDFQCPYCAQGRLVIDELKKKYGNKIRVAFKNFPLPFHNQARAAAEAALCAHEQDAKGAFWKMHDAMFGDQSKLAKEGLFATAKGLGLKEDVFRNCMDTQKYSSKIDADMEEGKKVGVKSTPTFFVNGQMVNGAQDIAVFAEIIDEALGK